MRKIKLILILIFNLAVLPGICLGATYYVDANKGNDANSGTIDASWQTLERAMPERATKWPQAFPAVKEGDAVYVASGTYNYTTNGENVIDTGRSDWINYVGDPENYPIIQGLAIAVTPNAYMRFYNFEIEERVVEGSSQDRYMRALSIEGSLTMRTSHIQFFNCKIISDDIAHFQGYTSKIKTADNIYFENCEFAYGWANGISNGANNITYKNSTFHHQWADSFTVYSHKDDPGGINNVLFEGCTFRDLIAVEGATLSGMHMDMMDIGCVSGTHTPINNLIIRNCIFEATYDPDWETWASNDPDGTPYGDNWQYSIFIGQQEGENLTVENSLFYGLQNAYWSQDGSRSNLDGLIVRNNTFMVNGTDPGVFKNRITSNTNIINRNNIWGGNLVFRIKSNNIDQSNNIYANYDSSFSDVKLGSNSVEIGEIGVRDLFVDYNNNFQLKSGSLAIDFGNPLNATLTDISGNYRDASPDAGCYEYGASSVRPEADGDSVINRTSLSAFNNVIKAGGNSQATIRCDLVEAGNLSVIIYDSKGKEIKILFNGQKDSGRHEFTWSAIDAGSGIYIVNMISGGYKETKKIAVIK